MCASDPQIAAALHLRLHAAGSWTAGDGSAAGGPLPKRLAAAAALAAVAEAELQRRHGHGVDDRNAPVAQRVRDRADACGRARW